MAKLCMGCMNPLPEGNTTCTVCGFDPAKDQNPEHCLPVTAALQGHYIVGRLMDEASDHLLYLAYDRQLREPCFIQEFFPAGISRRDTIGGVQPTEGSARIFEDYASQFRGTMRTLARMRELSSIVPVYDIFEENGTVYAVSDYCQGMTLTKKTKLAGGRIAWPEARVLFMPLLSGLSALNEAGICHLAICPDNILIGADGKARIRNFSIAAARQAGTDLVPQLQSGYAAPEQYRGDVDEAADVYGMAATLFRTVTGNEPPAGNARAKNSDDLFMSAEVAEELTQPVCVALFNALQVQPENRTATVAKLKEQLSVAPTVSALVDEVEEDMERTHVARNKAAKKDSKRGTKLALIFGGCLLALVLVALIVLKALGGNSGGETPDESTALPSYTTTTRPSRADGKIVVDNLVGLNYYDLRDIYKDGDLIVSVDHFEFSDKAAGTVLSQEPAASTETDPGVEVKVVISYGQQDETVKVPDVSGWKQEHAEAYLKALGFRVKTVLLQASRYEKGCVDSTDPVAGTNKRLGDTITLRVSNVEPTTSATTTTTTGVVSDPTDDITEPTDNTGDPNEDPNNTTSTDDQLGGETEETTTTTKKNGLFPW